MRYTLPDLRACHECLMIGPAEHAARHTRLTGHPTEPIGREEVEGVRLAWAEEGERCVRCGSPDHDEDGCDE